MPTDPRLEKLTDEQIEILFFNALNTPDDKILKKNYQENRKKERMVNGIPADKLREMGYTDEEIEQMKQGMMNA